MQHNKLEQNMNEQSSELEVTSKRTDDCHEDQVSKRRKIIHQQEQQRESNELMHDDDDYDEDDEEDEEYSSEEYSDDDDENDQKVYHVWQTESTVIKPFPDRRKYIHRKRAPASLNNSSSTSNDNRNFGGENMAGETALSATNNRSIKRHEIYVSRKSNRQAIRTRACKLLDECIMSHTRVRPITNGNKGAKAGHKQQQQQKQQQSKKNSSVKNSAKNSSKQATNTVMVNALVLHAIGAAIETCIDIALQLNDEYSNCSLFTMHVQTDTVKLVDDFIPRPEYEHELEPLVQVRYNSAVHITFQYHALSEVESRTALFNKPPAKSQRILSLR